MLTNVPRYWPSRSPVHCMRHVDRAAARPHDVREHRGVVELDVGRDPRRWPRASPPRPARRDRTPRARRPRRARHRRASAASAASSSRASDPRGDARVHLPLPRVLQRQRDGLAAPVLLPRQHRLRAAALVGAGEQHGRARLGRERRVDARHLRQVAPARQRRRLALRDLRRRVRLARARRGDLEPRELRRLRCARLRIDASGSASATGVPP